MAEPKRNIVVKIPRRKSSIAPPEEPKGSEISVADLRPPIACSLCGAALRGGTLQVAVPMRTELLLTKTGANDLLWVAKSCCLSHLGGPSEMFPAISGKVLCSVCGKVVLRGKRQQPSKSMFLLHGPQGENVIGVWFCSEACATIMSVRSCAPKSCWRCHEREFLLEEAISFAKNGKFGSPEEAATKAAKNVRKISFCAKCHFGAYCSEQCQKEDWPRHKLICKALACSPPLLRHPASFGPKICPAAFTLL